MSAYRYPLLIKHCLVNSKWTKAKEIVYRGNLRFTYLQFLDRVRRLGSALAQLHVQSGDVVAVMDWDTHRYLECFFAVPASGAILQTVNVRLSPDEIAYTLEHAGAKLILCNTEFAALLAAILPRLKQVRGVICIVDDAANTDQLQWLGEYEQLLSQGDAGFEFPDFDEETIATTFYTSGTTGLPKGVYYSHRQIVLHALAQLGTIALGDMNGHFSRETVYMPITPMFHAHAWGLPYVATMAGCTQIYPGRYVPSRLIELFRNERVTFSHCVPTLLHMMLTSPDAQDIDFSGWRVLVGGAAISTGLITLAESRGVNVITGYGMSETGPMLSMMQVKREAVPTRAAEHALRIKAGLAIPLVDLRIVDEQMRDLSEDSAAVGEIVARAPWLTQGYRNNPQASEALWKHGYLHTQDLGSLDEHGYLQVSDRIKDVIKSGGEWVSSLAVENIISTHPSVSEVAVISMPDPVWSERPAAIVVLKAGSAATEADIRKHVEERAIAGTISRYAVPDRVYFVTALARTSVGKIDKKLLRQHFQSELNG